jgi:SAM-dependent methyltransferase/4-hydroxybenzoate polyprenyltransferase/predicted  nucleic acid-binding Zn-ribbon protein
MKKGQIHTIYDEDYAQNYNQRFLLQENLSKIDSDFELGVIRSLLEEIGDNATWLDIACGTGYYLSHFPETQRAGLDISPAMLQVAQEANPSISFTEGDYREQYPEWNAKWDLVSCMFWAYAYVDSLSEIERVIENFASWTSDKGICFLPICDPSELGSGEVHIPYITEHIGEGGFYQLEALTWSWIENPEKQHRNLITPHPEWMITQFKKYFYDVRIVEYPKVKRHRIALVARSKKRRIDNQKVSLNIQKLIRSQEWWLYKIAPLLTIAYAETLLLQLPPTTATLTTLTALLSITSVAAYGYFLNDICDIESDQKANKPNAAAQLHPWQRLLLCLLFLSIGFAAPRPTHLGTIPLALLAANYLLPTLYSVPPLRLKERGIWGILSDAAGAHLVPTLFVAATLLNQTPDPPRNALIFTGVTATHAFFVGLRGILLHQLWDRANDLNAGITTFVTQRQPETVQRWINRLVFPVELLFLGGVALLLCQSTPALTAFFVVYLLLAAVNIKTALHPFTPSPPQNQNIIPHDLYEVWLPLALAITLAVQNPQFLIFVALTAMLFYPSIKVRITELFHVIKAGFTPMPNPTPSTPEALRPTPSNVAPLTPEMEQQLETPQTTNSIPSAEKLQEQLTQTQTKLTASKEQLHQSQVELEQLKIQLNQTQTHLEQSRSQLQQELTAANEQLHQKTTELATLKADYGQTQAELEQLREQLQTTQTQLQQTQSELERDRSQLQQTQSELERDRTQLQQTQAQLERDRTQLQQTQSELEQSQEQLQQTQIQLQISERQRQQTQALLEESQAELSEKTAELNQIKSQQHRDRLAEIIRRRFYSQR